jgi:hypothetical protein
MPVVTPTLGKESYVSHVPGRPHSSRKKLTEETALLAASNIGEESTTGPFSSVHTFLSVENQLDFGMDFLLFS